MDAKPIAIVEHEQGVSPGHFGAWVTARGLRALTVAIHKGDPLPRSAADFAGICSLGGAMSVNDPLPWIADELALMRDAIARGVPVIGHCLGGQLLARALGAPVTRAPFKEIGWLPLEIADPSLAQEWFGSANLPEIFQWHEDIFELPPATNRLASTSLAVNQAFVAARAGADHLGMQFHIEMTPELVKGWTSDPQVAAEIAAERAKTGGPGVQSISEIQRDLPRRTAQAKTIAWRLYDRWWGAVKRD